jgi:predicted anti-sigma-YlaC factor YlaD
VSTGNRIALSTLATVDIAIYLVLALLWPFAAAGAVALGLIWALSSGRSRS